MIEPFHNLLKTRPAPKEPQRDSALEEIGLKLKKEISNLFGRSLAIREVDSGSDNAAEIELNNLSNPYYDIERFGISFVASPKHADIMVVTGAVTLNMETAVLKTYEVMPAPKLVIAVGDDACEGGIFKGTYAVRGGVDKILPVDIKIPGDPPTPTEIMKGLLALIDRLKRRTGKV
jgi:Ni,Fe-hydrogenase III small subunit